MTGVLRQRWMSRSPRERWVWLGLGLAVALAAYLALVGAAITAREPLHRQVVLLRAEAARMDRQAAELAQLRAAPQPAVPAGELLAQVQAALLATPVPGSPARLDAADPAHLVVMFDAVAFADWLRWLDDLAARQVRLESCRVEALPASGQVSITATLARAGPP